MGCSGTKYVEIDPEVHKCFPYVQHPYASPILRKFTQILVMIAFLDLLSTFVYFSFNWDISNFINVANTQASILFAAVITHKCLSAIKMLALARELKKQMWSFDAVDPKVSREIRKRRQFLQQTRIILTVFSSIVICLCFPMTGNIGEIFVFIHYIQDALRPRIFHIIFSLTVDFLKVYFMFAVLSVNYICLLLTDDIVSYIILLRRKLQSIREIYGEKDDNYYDQSYQNYTNETLKTCISQHVLILKYAKMVKYEIETCLLVVAFLGILCLASLYVKAKMEHGIRFIVNSILFHLINVTCVFLYCNTGQLLMDECENLYHELCQCPWILWNESNKFNYQMFLLHSRDPVIISSLGLSVNNRFVVVAMQRVVSLMAFIEQTSTKL